ncbi:thermonuclease family protein [Roseicyclus sp. F158]|uniref:Thermonuclease family protein n=1 Tax=Tropicimonas omnivorans TaxID=3075590 RepID=A0ABU3DM01_9RHOB|nr:thermonuclease family protein [Roseicyclus sp. F158]MDT0684613.1 thermonuclease family protein [Roseicyclus sp. F158]
MFVAALVVLAGLAPGGLELIRWNDQLGRWFDRFESDREPATTATLSGRAKVVDGDTLRVDDERVRLFGIDAPESDQSCARPDGTAWQCGQAATQALEAMIVAGQVDCEVRDVDRYGRSVAICQSGSVELNREMVAQGLAVAYREYSRRYVGDERAAREIDRGIWATEFVMPQEWRSR